MIYAYYRVSTVEQDYESQKFGVVEYCKRHGYTIDKEYLDNGISGKVKASERNLGKLLRALKKDDMIITGELSRLGRSTADVLETCNRIIKIGANCYFVKQNMSIDNSPMGKMMIAILAAFGEMERDLISQRTKEALARVKAGGKILGRRPGSLNENRLSNRFRAELIAAHETGLTSAQTARQLNMCSTAVRYAWQELGFPPRHHTGGKSKKRIKCIETGQIYPSIATAASATRTSQGKISSVLRGRTKMAGGYTWIYI